MVSLRNFTTLMSKAFYATGRVTSEHGLRRIRQNIRHLIEIMLPQSMENHRDGWKLSVRIRLIHAQVRRLIRQSGEWDESVYGIPLNAAHMGVASANFSATMLSAAARLGADIDDDARRGFMQIWRYATCLIGSPEALLFEGDETGTLELYRIAAICEPPPGEESVVIARTLVEALPDIAGRSDPAARREMVEHAYRVSRALLGDELADGLRFPQQRTAGVLTWMRSKRQTIRTIHRIAPGVAARWRGKNYSFLLEASVLDALSYRIRTG